MLTPEAGGRKAKASYGILKRLEAIVELLTTERFGSVFGFRVSDGLPLHIVRPISPTALKRDTMIDDVISATFTCLTGARTGMGLAKFKPCRRAALNSPIRISWTRRALPSDGWNG